MLKFKTMITLALFIGSMAVYSDRVKYSDSWGSQGFSISKSSATGVSLTHSINEFSITDRMINSKMKSTIQLPGVFLPNDAGAPDLPGSARYIAIPQGAKATYNIISSKKEVFQNIELAPAPKLPFDTDNSPMVYKENSEIYSKDAFYPSSPVIISEQTKIRGLDVVTLGITPFQYNPVTKELVVYRDLIVDVTFEGGNNHFGEDRLRNRHWDKILKNTVINNSVIEDVEYNFKSDSKGIDYEYIIICPDDATFISYANQLRDFRTKQGIRTGVVTITEIGGNTAAAIETYINNAYNTWTIPPSAVLMLGDWGVEGSEGTLYSPKFDYGGSPYCVSDNFYADVETTDGKGLPEITFARMTAQNETHLQVMISKIINYETSPPTDPNFYSNPITALGWQTERWFQICSESVGGYMKNELGKTPVRINAVYDGNPDVDPWSIATNTSQVLDYFGHSGKGYIPASPTDLGGWTGGDASDVTNALNNGAFILQHRDHGATWGWGEPDFTSDDISTLTNTDLSFVFSINCLTGKYDDASECFAEKFHRYTYNGQNAGTIGILAASESSMSFVNDTFVWGIYDYIWPNFMDDYGTPPTDNDEFYPAFAAVNGKFFLDYSSWPYNVGDKELTNYLFHLHGDPYINVYTEVPQLLTVSYEELFDGESYVYVTADLGSVIALVANGEVIGTGIGTGGLTTVDIDPQFTGTEITLTVTKQNYFRDETIFSVSPPNTNIGGIYSQSTSNLNYGNITLGGNLAQQFTITNSHSVESIVGEMTTIAGYTVSPVSKSLSLYEGKEAKNVINYSVPPSTVRTFELLFDPATAGDYNGDISITSSDTNHSTEYITVTGACVIPDINLNPTDIATNVSPESSIVENFNIDNQDQGRLDYSISINYTSGKEIKASGGPDTYGYKWKDSDEANGPVYSWEEINGIGTALGLSDDAISASLDIGFTFNYYGVDYTTVRVGANGATTFTGAAISPSNAPLPYSDATNAIVAAFWDDINPSSGGEIYHYQDVSNNRFIIEWDAVVDYGASTPNTFQIILNENGKILFQYKDMQGDKLGCTIGIEDHNGTDGCLVIYNSAYVQDNLAIEFSATPLWLSLNSIAGSIDGIGSDQIEATCDAEGLELGTYTADIIIASNDPDESTKVLPVSLTVADNPGGIFSISETLMEYGNVTIGYSEEDTFTINNSHVDETIYGNITTIPGYTVSVVTKSEDVVKNAKNILDYTVSPNSNKTFNLVFDPVSAGDYNGNITITSSDTNHATEYVAVTGACVVPDIDVPLSIAASTAPGDTVIKYFDIDNLDLGILDYGISINYTSGKEIKASGGPDTYGYKWKDSDEVGGPIYDWVEINSLGTALGLADDGESDSLSLDFTFNYYGVDYTSIVVGSNGTASFTETDITYNNTTIPTGGELALLAVFWDDLNPVDGGEIYYYYDSANSRFIIEWDGVVDFSSTTPNTFQAIIYASGKIIYQYKDMQGVLNECTIGIGDHIGTDGSSVIFNAAYLHNDLVVQFSATPEWLSLDTTIGTVPGSGSVQVEATYDASKLALGVYTADITISSNDPDEATKILPVTFTVSDMTIPEVPANIVTSISGTDLILDWDESADATGYDVYSSDDPYGTFTLAASVGTNQYTIAADQAKLFYYIVATNTTK